jgi:hypothetical protein
MTCASIRELLAAFADGGLEGRERERVAAHVAGCAACAEEVRLLREILVETRRAAAPTTRDESFWQDLTRDIRTAVAAEPAPRMSFWRLPLVAFGLAAALGAVLYVSARGDRAAPAVATRVEAPAPLPRTVDPEDVDDLDDTQLEAVNAALSDDYADAPDDDELAVSAPPAPETLIENLSDEAVARVVARL